MVDLQELIVRGRMIFDGPTRRLQVFELVNGNLSTKEIARKAGRSLPSVGHDIQKLRDLELIREKKDNKGETIKKNGSVVYEKSPLIRHISISYFQGVPNTSKLVKKSPGRRARTLGPQESIYPRR